MCKSPLKKVAYEFVLNSPAVLHIFQQTMFTRRLLLATFHHNIIYKRVIQEIRGNFLK